LRAVTATTGREDQRQDAACNETRHEGVSALTPGNAGG
jgi:hypothetical protein